MWNFDPGGMEATSNDLPLMSNIKDIRVKHYLLDLKVDLNDRIFTGSATLFLEQPTSSGGVDPGVTGKCCPLPQGCDHSESCLFSQGVSDKVGVIDEWSVAEDVIKIASAHFSEKSEESRKSWRTKKSECCLPAGCDHSKSRSSSQGVSDKVGVVDEGSVAEDMKIASAQFIGEPEERVKSLNTNKSASLSSGFEETSDGTVLCHETPGFKQSPSRLSRKVMDVDKVVCDGGLDTNVCGTTTSCSEIEDPSDKIIESDKRSLTRSNSKESPSSLINNIIEEVVSPCKTVRDDLPQMSRVCSTSKEGSSFLSSIEENPPQNKDFVMILDCCDIDIEGVEELILDKSKFGVDTNSAGETVTGDPTRGTEQHLKSEGGTCTLIDKNEKQNSEQQYGTAGKSLAENLCFKSSEYGFRRERFLSCQSMERRPLGCEVEPWCLKIWKKGVKAPGDFPAAICIRYKTRPSGKSLTWAVDQGGRPCVFTQGAWINNRSLFPCQEPPGAMATWQAIIHAPEDLMVVMSGDEEGRVIQKKEGMVSSLHFTDMLQPSSIVTIAIGKWRCYNVQVSQPEGELQPDKKHLFSLTESNTGTNRESTQSQCNHDEWPCRIGREDQPIIPSRIIAPPSILEAAVKEFSSYLPRCLHAVFHILGPHPFSRLDVLILPRCFASLGLASPSLIFLSQSLLSGDGSFLPRLAHEISHSWFGILIGARDWTEEWLSEGFATFMEDPIHAVAQNWTSKQYQDQSALKTLLRYQALKAELENTESELQIMRPMAGGTGASKESDGGGEVGFVKNGLNPDKWFLQVHYLKGYFLLHHIASHLSMEKTLQFINLYVMRYHRQLVLSKDIFQLLFDEYPELKDQGVTMETIYSDWLDKAGMPGNLNPEIYQKGNALISDVMAELKRWMAIDKFHQKSNKKKRRKIMSSQFHDHPTLKLSPDQLTLLLEGILDVETIETETLEDVNTTYNLTQQNAEARHRWCELVVKHRFVKAYPNVRCFLMEDQAMGVYLYGELMASEDPVQQALARDCFQSVAMEMDRGCYRTVHEMVYGEPAERDDT